MEIRRLTLHWGRLLRFVAATGYITGISPDPTANFVGASTCDSQQSASITSSSSYVEKAVVSIDDAPQQVATLEWAEVLSVTTTYREALRDLATDALAVKGCVRFDVYEEYQDVARTVSSNKLWMYAVFDDSEAKSDFESSVAKTKFDALTSEMGGNGGATAMALPVGVQTQTVSKKEGGTPPMPILFWLRAKTADDLKKVQDAIRPIVDPTRAEPGCLRYDQAFTIGSEDLFVLEVIWYEQLPASQTAHMASAYIATFFVDTGSIPTFTYDDANMVSLLPTPSSYVEKAAAKSAVASYIQYYYVANHSTIANNKPECNFYEAEDLGRKVPDACCVVSAWPDGSGMSSPGPDARTGVKDDSGEQFSCYVRERAGPNAGSYIRNFFGCWNGDIQAQEGCLPAGTGPFNGYPMNESFAQKSSENGNPETCNCEGSPYIGDGCFVAATGYITGISPDPTANFVKVVGASTCR